MIQYYCDGCGKVVDSESGVIGMKEITLEFDDKKVSIAIEVDSMTRIDNRSDDIQRCALAVLRCGSTTGRNE